MSEVTANATPAAEPVAEPLARRVLEGQDPEKYVESLGIKTKPANSNGSGNKAPNTKSSGKVGKAIQLLGAIGAESAVGFGTGFMLGKGNKGGVVGTIIAMSFVFGLEFYVRYNKATSSWALFLGGFLLLVAAGIVPYLAMTSPKVKGKGKTGAAAAPTMAGAWALAALLYGVVCAMMSKNAVAVADALQGVILSLLYAGVTVAGGYSAAAQPANLPYALATWGALVLFDMAGLARAPPATGVPAAANTA